MHDGDGGSLTPPPQQSLTVDHHTILKRNIKNRWKNMNVIVEILKLAATASASLDDAKWRSQVVSETAELIESGTTMYEQKSTWVHNQWYNPTFRQPIFQAYVEWVRI